MTELATQLNRFAVRVNEEKSLRKTLAGWKPEFFIQVRESGETFQVVFADSRVERVFAVDTEPDDDALLMRADQAILHEIFSGARSPLGAYTDGLLEVYGDQKDQIKLDVMALVLWGA